MGFRTLEISRAAEIHIKEGQLKITTDDGVAIVPIEDFPSNFWNTSRQSVECS